MLPLSRTDRATIVYLHSILFKYGYPYIIFYAIVTLTVDQVIIYHIRAVPIPFNLFRKEAQYCQ